MLVANLRTFRRSAFSHGLYVGVRFVFARDAHFALKIDVIDTQC